MILKIHNRAIFLKLRKKSLLGRFFFRQNSIRANGEILCIQNTKDFSIRPYETVFLNYLENSLPPDSTVGR